MKRIMALILASTLLLSLAACSDNALESTNAPATPSTGWAEEETGTVAEPSPAPEIAPSTVSVEYDGDDLDSSVSSTGTSTIRLEGDSLTVDGNGATVSGNVVTITSAGVYNISGTLNDGQILVDTQDEEAVRLVLNGADIACSTSAPIYAINAEKTVITLADGTENTITDGSSYFFEDAESNEPNAAIFSNDDLTINGNGSLTVNANNNHGIASDDDLKITGGHITVNAANDGIKGRDSVIVRDGTITITAGGDGMQSDNDEDTERGYIAVEGGTLNITAGGDGLQAETTLVVSGGDITILSGGGSSESQWGWGDSSATSAKGIKAGVNVTVTGGTIDIDSADDALHSNDSVFISGGNITLASGDDGIHSDSALEINGGDIWITESYEGIESSVITINDGTIHLIASDDGINAVSGNAGSEMNGRPGQNPFEASGNDRLYINGGTTSIDAEGDGLDINGAIEITGGTVIINGPTANNNGALDYLGACQISGGLLVAAGSAGMAQAPSESSTQHSVIVAFPSALPAGTIIHIETDSGQDVLTFVPTKTVQSIVLSSPELSDGATYVVYTGGSSTGTLTDSVYYGGTYTGGTQMTSFTISSIVTGAGASSGGFPAGPGGGFPGGPGGGGRPSRP